MDYYAILRKAEQAAAEAGFEWLRKAEAAGPKYSVHEVDLFTGEARGPSQGVMLDACGFGWLEFSDKRSAFYRYCKKLVNETARFPERTLYRVPIHGEYDALRSRQEMGLKEAAMRAAAEVFAEHDIKVYVRTRMD